MVLIQNDAVVASKSRIFLHFGMLDVGNTLDTSTICFEMKNQEKQWLVNVFTWHVYMHFSNVWKVQGTKKACRHTCGVHSSWESSCTNTVITDSEKAKCGLQYLEGCHILWKDVSAASSQHPCLISPHVLTVLLHFYSQILQAISLSSPHANCKPFR